MYNKKETYEDIQYQDSMVCAHLWNIQQNKNIVLLIQIQCSNNLPNSSLHGQEKQADTN